MKTRYKLLLALFVSCLIIFFVGCAESSLMASEKDDLQVPYKGYTFGDITAYEPVSRIDSPWWILRARKGNKWGYVDSVSGRIVIPFDFDFVDDLIYNSGKHFARVFKDGKCSDQGQVLRLEFARMILVSGSASEILARGLLRSDLKIDILA